MRTFFIADNRRKIHLARLDPYLTILVTSGMEALEGLRMLDMLIEDTDVLNLPITPEFNLIGHVSIRSHVKSEAEPC